jgi:hypothetical protein
MDSSLIELLNGAGLGDLTGGRGAPHLFIARMMAENKKKHKGQYKYPTTLPYGSKMNAPVVFEYKKLANQQQSASGENPREYGASPFITKHFGSDEEVPFVPKRPPKPPYEEPPPRPERQINPKWWSGYNKGLEVLNKQKQEFRQKKENKKAKLDARIAREIEQGIRDPLVPVPERVEEKYEGDFPPARAFSSSSSSSSSSTPMGAVVPDSKREKIRAKILAEIEKKVAIRKAEVEAKRAEKEAKRVKNEEIRARNEEIRARKEEIRARNVLKEQYSTVKAKIKENIARMTQLKEIRESVSGNERKRFNEEARQLNENQRQLYEDKRRLKDLLGKDDDEKKE